MKRTIKLEKVVINNFKSFKHYEHNFDLGHETISGHFGCGKSTIRKSLDFVLGMKVEDFRPCEFVDNEWKEIESVDATDVSWQLAVQDENGIISNYKLQVIADDKGTKYYVDDLKISTKTKYQEQLVNIFGVDDYDQLLLITHLDNFLSLDWNKQRETLKKLTNVEKVLDSVKNSEKYQPLKEYFDKGFGEVEIKKVLTKQKKDLESEKDKVIGALREQETAIKNYEEIDFNSVEKEINTVDQELKSLDSSTITSKINETNIKYNANSREIANLEQRKSDLEKHISVVKHNIDIDIDMINQHKESIKNLENEIKELQEKEFEYNDEKSECPYCHSIIEPLSHEEQEIEFEKERLLSIEDDVEHKKAVEENLRLTENGLKFEKEELEKSEKQIEDINNKIKDFEEHNEVLQMDIDYYKGLDNSEKINALQSKRRNLFEKFSCRSFLINAKARCSELEKEKNNIIKQIQNIISLEELRNEYSLDTMKIVEEHINSYFSKDVYWKLFSQLITTGEYKEDLVLISNGKRYDTACSNGEKILANISVVLGLQNILNKQCFIFVDDFNDLGVGFKCEQQLILLETKANADLDNLERY